MPETRFQAFDLLATLVLVVQADNRVLFANASFEDVMGLSRRHLQAADVPSLFVDEAAIAQSLDGARRHDFAALRFDAQLKRQAADPFAVHVVVAATEDPREVLMELLPQETQSRQDREERQLEHAQANKELIRNLAHEIKNPLGGIRGAAQLLQLELDSRDLTEYTQVIVREADRLQTLVDRLLAPHRRPHVVARHRRHPDPLGGGRVCLCAGQQFPPAVPDPQGRQGAVDSPDAAVRRPGKEERPHPVGRPGSGVGQADPGFVQWLCPGAVAL